MGAQLCSGANPFQLGTPLTNPANRPPIPATFPPILRPSVPVPFKKVLLQVTQFDVFKKISGTVNSAKSSKSFFLNQPPAGGPAQVYPGLFLP